MRTFDYLTVPPSLQATPVTNLLLAIREYKGRQALWTETRPDLLEDLLETAQAQSVGASNRIEGIVTTERRLEDLVTRSDSPRTRAEEEIAGYRDVLALIHEQHDYIPVTPGVILQLHRDLLAHTPLSFGGSWKDTDDQIVTRNADGSTSLRFRPTPAHLTPDAVARLCETYDDAFRSESCDPALLAARFTFDFVSIHPFNDGNGRMSRLITVLLLERAGYLVPQFISIEHLIERSRDQYYEALAQSSTGWAEGTNDEAPFVRYLLGIILAAYRELEGRMGAARPGRERAVDRVRDVFIRHVGKVTKAMVLDECPDLSEVTVKRSLSALLADGVIRKVGAGRQTGYVRAE